MGIVTLGNSLEEWQLFGKTLAADHRVPNLIVFKPSSKAQNKRNKILHFFARYSQFLGPYLLAPEGGMFDSRLFPLLDVSKYQLNYASHSGSLIQHSLISYTSTLALANRKCPILDI